jgi:hypothetical protein
MYFIDLLRPDRPCSRLWYLISTALLIDLPLESEVRNHAWVLAGALVLLLVYITARRFIEIGWNRRWAIPYALFTLSPYAVLCFHPDANVRLITLAVVLLQVPAMVWPKRRAIGSTGGSQVAGGSGFE